MIQIRNRSTNTERGELNR